VQDDILDWEQECPRISTVYNRFAVCLVAAGAANANGGLYCQGQAQNSAFKQILMLELVVNDGPQSILLAGPWSGYHWEGVYFEHSPLLKRGWAVQERLLSPRYTSSATRYSDVSRAHTRDR
jgi:hypothetical protein